MESNVSWDKKAVIDYIKPKLWLYLFKESYPELKADLNNLMIQEADLEILKRVHFLLSKEVKDLVQILPQIMRNLSHSTQKEVVKSQGIIKGRVDWNLTFKERYSSGYNDKSLFMCKPASRMYDLPENQILKYLLVNLAETAESFDFFRSKEKIEIDYLKENWQDELLLRYIEIKRILNNIYIQNLTLPMKIRSRDLQRLRNHRNKYYRNQILKCYELYNNIFNKNDLNCIKDLIENQLLKPKNDEDIFELYVLFKLMNQLEVMSHQNDARMVVNLIMANYKKEFTAKYYDSELTIKVYYQHLPYQLSQNSIYKDLLKKYSLNVRGRLPDLILEIEHNNKIYYKIIEVKLTEDHGYVRDSIYKLLGYLKDFESGINNSKDPKGVLVIWDGVNDDNGQNNSQNEILIWNSNDICINNILNIKTLD